MGATKWLPFLCFTYACSRKYKAFYTHIQMRGETYSGIKGGVYEKSTICCIVKYDEGILRVRFFYMTKKQKIDKITS